MARALPSILPRLTFAEALDITRVYSVTDALPPGEPLVRTRPFRAPRPGEISLAHRGLLFLDEFGEYGSRNLETLHQPLEDREVTISRAQGSLTFPANFILVAAMNPCPYDYTGDDTHICTCSPGMVSKDQKRISGPLLDRIDIHLDVRLDVHRVPYQKLSSLEQGETSATIRARVETARAVQQARFGALGKPNVLVNGDMGPAEVQRFCKLDEAGKNLMRAAVAQMDLSARAYHRVLKLARTVADLAGEANTQAGHLAEALQYRPRSVA